MHVDKFLRDGEAEKPLAHVRYVRTNRLERPEKQRGGGAVDERRELPAQPFARPSYVQPYFLLSLRDAASSGDTAAIAHSIAVSGHPQVPLLYLHSPPVAGTEVPCCRVPSQSREPSESRVRAE